METNKPNNPSAFAFGTESEMQYGMTLRDYFANSAMQANLTSPELMEVVSIKQIEDKTAFDAIARVSYQIADAMLKQREL
jgi:arginase family enzyme